MNVDYIIVGSGLAGILFAEVLNQHDKSFVVFDDSSQQSSSVAGVLYNPVTLKRFTPVWKAKEQLDIALPMYHEIERRLNIKLDEKIPIYRLFASVEEQNNWFNASDKPGLKGFLSTEIMYPNTKTIINHHGFGKVMQSGRIDTALLIEKYRNHLELKQQFFKERFDYGRLEFNETNIIYNNLQAKYIVFAEGFGLKKNPFFKDLPLRPTKGELLTISAPDLKIDFVLKSSVFLIPIGNDLYKVGSTYNWGDTSPEITKPAKEELLQKLDKFLNCDFKVVDQVAGIRPTVKDRRPLVGQHDRHKNIFVLNGLGTRGVMNAPFVSVQLYNFIEKQIPLEKAIDINRFK